MASPEERARQEIDRLLTAAGWAVQDFKGDINRILQQILTQHSREIMEIRKVLRK